MSNSEEKRPPIWEAFCTALGTEYRETTEIVGASGLVHPVEAIGVDEKTNRLIIVSADSNPRVAALLRGDVQQTTPDLRVMVARPLALDIAHTARETFFTSSGSLDVAKIIALSSLNGLGADENAIKEHLGKHFAGPAARMWETAQRSSLPISNHIFNLVEQVQSLDWESMRAPEGTKDLMEVCVDLLTQFSRIDSLAGDREQGICPVPTYELSDEDWDLFGSTKNIEEVQERLKALQIYQYFYPPADSLALGLIDRGNSNLAELRTGFELSEAQGHEVVENSLVPSTKDFHELIDAMKSKGYVMEGEFSMETTSEGKTIRNTVQVRPSEGLIARLSRILSLKVDLNLKDLMNGK